MENKTSKRVLVVGASPNSDRYSYRATLLLAEKGHEVIPFGTRKGSIGSHKIINEFPSSLPIHTVTMYMNSERQKVLHDQILMLQPKRIIFNPGAESEELMQKANKQGIETENACTLVMLNLGVF